MTQPDDEPAGAGREGSRVATGDLARHFVEDRVLGLPTRTLCYFLLYLAALDAWITAELLVSERGIELNPVMNWLFESGGALTFVFAKLVLTSGCLLWINRRAPPRHARLAFIIALAIYLPVAGLHILNSHHL